MVHTAPVLEKPGAGLPRHHYLFARYLAMPLLYRSLSWESAQNLFEAEGRKIVRLARTLTPEQMTRRVLVSGVFGIEDSSRYWSVAMAMEHLMMVGDLIADVLGRLGRREDIPYTLAIKDVKPKGQLDPRTLPADFEAFLARHRLCALHPSLDRDSPAAFHHPWFGPLTARQWQCFAPVHQRIHRRQAEAIVAGL